MGNRHTMYYMGKEYPNIPIGGGAGGGGEGSTIDTLYQYDGITQNPATITLAHSVEDYDFLLMTARASGGGIQTSLYKVEDLELGDTIGAGFIYTYFLWYYLTSMTLITFRTTAGGYWLESVTGIKLGSGGVTPTPTEEGIVLFDGSWKNQDKVTITPYLATITNNELVCSGLHCGIVVSSVSGVPSDYNPYQLIVEGHSQGFSFQAGRCYPTSDLNSIIAQGTNRLSWTNDSVTSGAFKFHLKTTDSSQGVFLGGGYNVSNTEYTISKITLAKNSSEREYV